MPSAARTKDFNKLLSRILGRDQRSTYSPWPIALMLEKSEDFDVPFFSGDKHSPIQ